MRYSCIFARNSEEAYVHFPDISSAGSRFGEAALALTDDQLVSHAFCAALAERLEARLVVHEGASSDIVTNAVYRPNWVEEARIRLSNWFVLDGRWVAFEDIAAEANRRGLMVDSENALDKIRTFFLNPRKSEDLEIGASMVDAFTRG